MDMDRRWRAVLCAMAAATLMCAPAAAEQITWSADDPFAAGDVIEIDLGAELLGVTSVEFRAIGTAGSQAYWCMVCCDPEGFGGSVPVFLDLQLDKPDLYSDALATAAMTSYWGWSEGVWTLAAQPATGHEDWAFLADGVFSVTKWGHHSDYPYPFPYCTAIPGSTPVQVDRLEMTITCGVIVADEASSWGRVKAIYR